MSCYFPSCNSLVANKNKFQLFLQFISTCLLLFPNSNSKSIFFSILIPCHLRTVHVGFEDKIPQFWAVFYSSPSPHPFPPPKDCKDYTIA